MSKTQTALKVDEVLENKMLSVLSHLNEKECTNVSDLHTLKELAEIYSLLRD